MLFLSYYFVFLLGEDAPWYINGHHGVEQSETLSLSLSLSLENGEIRCRLHVHVIVKRIMLQSSPQVPVPCDSDHRAGVRNTE